MLDLIGQIQKGFEAAKESKIDFKPDRIIFCGMGGSIIPAEIIAMLELPINAYLNRTSYLPNDTSKNDLIVCTSWSGNTEETISCFKEAVEKNTPVIAITKGGELAKLAKTNNQLSVFLPEDNIPARYGVGYMLGVILTLLSNSDIIENTLAKPLNIKEKPTVLFPAIRGKVPLVYSSYNWHYLGRFWKVFFNETVKLHSFSNYFPGAGHNEISAFLGNQFFPIILMDPAENPEDIKVLNKFSKFLKSKGIEHEIVELEGQTRLEKILNQYNLIIQTTNELASTLGVDPFENKAVEEFKKL